MARTQDFNIIYGAKLAKQIQPAAADLYGGGTYATLGANNQVRLDNLEIVDTPEFFEDTGKNESIFGVGHEIAAVPCSFTGESKVYTQGLEDIIFACFGFEDLDGPLNYSTTEYSHLISLTSDGKDQREYTSAEAADATGNLAFSPAYASGDYVNSYINFIRNLGPSEEKICNGSISEFTFSASSKEPLKLEFSGLGELVQRDTGKTEASNLTEASGRYGEFFMLRHADSVKFGPVASLTERDIFDFSIKVTHGQADLFPTGTSNSGKSRSEPVATGESEMMLEMTINKHDTDDFKTWEQANTECQCSISFTRGVDRFIFLMPSLRLKNVENIVEDGSKIKITCKGYKPTGADPFSTERNLSGTTHDVDYATPLYVVISNQDSSNYMRVSS